MLCYILQNHLYRWLPGQYFILLMMGAWRPNHVEKVCINKICISLHHFGVLFILTSYFLFSAVCLFPLVLSVASYWSELSLCLKEIRGRFPTGTPRSPQSRCWHLTVDCAVSDSFLFLLLWRLLHTMIALLGTLPLRSTEVSAVRNTTLWAHSGTERVSSSCHFLTFRRLMSTVVDVPHR